MSNQEFFYTYYKRRGNSILLKYTKNGKKRVTTIKDYKPSLYFPDNVGDTTDGVKSIYGDILRKKKFDSIKEASFFGKDYAEMGGSQIYGNRFFENQFMIELFEGGMPNYNTKLIDVGIIDIETDYDQFPDPQYALFQIQQIDIKSTQENIHYSFGLKDYEHFADNKDVGHCTVIHTQFETEEELLKAFIMHIEDHAYDMTTGWNSEQFDMPYIINRCRKVLGEAWTNRLSPFGLIYEREVVNQFKNAFIKYEIVGLPHIDYMEAYKKHTYTPRENYKLDHIAYCELGTNKVDYSDDSKSLKELWENNPQLYVAYNIQDVELIHKLDQKLGLFDLIFTLTYVTLSNFEDSMGTTRIWEQMIAKHLYNSNIAPLFTAASTDTREFEGAFVHPTQSGMHDWVASFDLASLYPHIIQQVNVGPETIVPYHELPDDVKAIISDGMVQKLLDKKVDTSALKKHKLSLAANGSVFRTDKQSFLAELMKDLYDKRTIYKKKMKEAKKAAQKATGAEKAKLEDLIVQYDNLQMGMKILLNSLYGALGNRYFLYYMVDTAEAITTTGQLVNKWCSYKTNDFLCDVFNKKDNYITSGDTDSFYITLYPLGNKLMQKTGDVQKTVDKLDQFCGLVGKELEKYCDDLAEYLNSYKQAMAWEREVIAEKAVLVAKKKYTMKVWDDEGLRLVDEPKYKIMGMESVKSSTPQWARSLLEECYKIALNSTESDLHKAVSDFEQHFYKLPIEDIAIPRGVNNIKKYTAPDPKKIYIKGTPKNVKGVLIHNWMIDKMELKLNKILKDGSKIKYISLRKPNPINQEVIAFDGAFPKEFGLEKYVNKRELFEKGFLDALKLYLDVINWNHEEVNTLF